MGISDNPRPPFNDLPLIGDQMEKIGKRDTLILQPFDDLPGSILLAPGDRGLGRATQLLQELLGGLLILATVTHRRLARAQTVRGLIGLEQIEQERAELGLGIVAVDWWPDRGLVRQSVDARAAVIRFPSAGVADTGAKLASLGRVERAEDLRAEVRSSIEHGNATYDDLALIVIAEMLEMGGLGAASIVPLSARPDPIFGLIEEARRLTRKHGRLIAISADLPDSHPAWKAENEAHAAMWEHVRGVLLKTVPTTAAGCVALARFAYEFTEDQGVSLEYESNDPVLALIARSPAL